MSLLEQFLFASLNVTDSLPTEPSEVIDAASDLSVPHYLSQLHEAQRPATEMTNSPPQPSSPDGVANDMDGEAPPLFQLFTSPIPNGTTDPKATECLSISEEDLLLAVEGLETPLYGESEGSVNRSEKRNHLQFPFVMSRDRNFVGQGESCVVYEGSVAGRPVAIKLIPIHPQSLDCGRRALSSFGQVLSGCDDFEEDFRIRGNDAALAKYRQQKLFLLRQTVRSICVQHTLGADSSMGLVPCLGSTVVDVVEGEVPGSFRVQFPCDAAWVELQRAPSGITGSDGLFQYLRMAQHPPESDVDRAYTTGRRHSAAVRRMTVVVAAFERALASANDILSLKGALSEAWVVSIARDVVSSLAHLHAAGWVHGDVKPRNILLFAADHALTSPIDVRTTRPWQLRALLSDLDCAQKVSLETCDALGSPLGTELSSHMSPLPSASPSGWGAPSQRRRCPLPGTPAYMSPQACKGIITCASDVWAVGITMAELVSGCLPWSPMEAQHPHLILTGFRGGLGQTSGVSTHSANISTSDGGFRPVLDQVLDLLSEGKISADIVALLKHCLSTSTSLRPSSAEVLAGLERLAEKFQQ